jgi:tetratricopeptide (TPR) repeat protein
LGVAYFNLHQLDNACYAYERALQIKPGYSLGFSNYAAALFQMGQYKKAADMWMQAMKIDPSLDATYHNLIIYYCTISHEYNKAREIQKIFESTGRKLPPNLLSLFPPGT